MIENEEEGPQHAAQAQRLGLGGCDGMRAGMAPGNPAARVAWGGRAACPPPCGVPWCMLFCFLPAFLVFRNERIFGSVFAFFLSFFLSFFRFGVVGVVGSLFGNEAGLRVCSRVIINPVLGAAQCASRPFVILG